MTDPFGHKVKIYIFAMVMSHSRKKYVYFQDHPFNAGEFVEAHDLAFKYYGGRTQEIVYDQDRVMAVSENAGDLVLTNAFENYRKYIGLPSVSAGDSTRKAKAKLRALLSTLRATFCLVGIITAYRS